MNAHALLQEVLEHLRLALATRLEAPARVAPATASGQMWTVRAIIARDLQITFAFDQTGAGELACVLSGQEEPADDVIKSSLRELCDDVVAAAATKLTAPGDDLLPSISGDPELTEWAATAPNEVVSVSCATLPATLIVSIAASGAAIVEREPVGATEGEPSAEPSAAERLDVLLDIDLPLLVRFGCTQLPLKALSRLGPGSLIDLSRAPDDPVELLVGDRIVARGEVVVVSGSYGIRVLEVVGSRDGGRAMEVS